MAQKKQNERAYFVSQIMEQLEEMPELPGTAKLAIEHRCLGLTEYFDKRANENQGMFNRSQIAIMLLNFLAAFIGGTINPENAALFGKVVTVSNLAAALLVKFQDLFRYEAKYIEARTNGETCLKELWDFVRGRGSYAGLPVYATGATKDAYGLLCTRIEAINEGSVVAIAQSEASQTEDQRRGVELPGVIDTAIAPPIAPPANAYQVPSHPRYSVEYYGEPHTTVYEPDDSFHPEPSLDELASAGLTPEKP